MRPDAPVRWYVVIPVKLLAQAKTRLTGLAAEDRAELVLAMAADTVVAAAAADPVERVVVVTDDPAVAAEARELGALVVSDEPAAGLNEALAFGARQAREQWPDGGLAGLAGLAADLPALQPGELSVALNAAAQAGRAFVPDAEGTGTTLYAAGPGQAFEPLFGGPSRARHRAAGLAELDLPGLLGLRRDVDTAAELRLAARIGLGPRTRSLLAASGLP
jgi:2-phospho-L-lactate/phosphoenolpyruvate guanylyltransferase